MRRIRRVVFNAHVHTSQVAGRTPRLIGLAWQIVNALGARFQRPRVPGSHSGAARAPSRSRPRGATRQRHVVPGLESSHLRHADYGAADHKQVVQNSDVDPLQDLLQFLGDELVCQRRSNFPHFGRSKNPQVPVISRL